MIGVARRGFFGTRPGFGPDVWAPLMMVQPLSAGGIRPRERNQNYLEMMRWYFEAVGISLLRGRDFSRFDGKEGVQVAILNEAAARLLLGTQDPIGRRIGPGRQGPAEIEVIGLVEDAKYP